MWVLCFCLHPRGGRRSLLGAVAGFVLSQARTLQALLSISKSLLQREKDTLEEVGAKPSSFLRNDRKPSDDSGVFVSVSPVPLCGALWPWRELSSPGPGWGATEGSEHFTGDGPRVAGGLRAQQWESSSAAGKGAQKSLRCASERMALLVGPRSGGRWRVFSLLLVAIPEGRAGRR